MAARIKVTARPSDVRAWAVENGFTVGTRGKFSQELITAFNRANGVKYVPAAHVETVTVTAKPAKGRSVTRKVNVAMARAAAVEAGVPMGKRGRVSQEVLSAYVLGDFSHLV